MTNRRTPAHAVNGYSAWVTEKLRATWHGLDGRPVFGRRQKPEAGAPPKEDADKQARLRPLPATMALVPFVPIRRASAQELRAVPSPVIAAWLLSATRRARAA